MWRALLLSEICLLITPAERARESSSLTCAPLVLSIVVIVLALSRGMSSTGTRTVLREFESSELARRDCIENFLLFFTELEARRLQAAKLSFVASPVNPSEASHSVKMVCHLLLARTVQVPIRLSSLAILRRQIHTQPYCKRLSLTCIANVEFYTTQS